MDSNGSVGIAFIGTGFARKVQMPAFKMAGGCRVVSVASASLENAASAATEFGADHFTDDWRTAIDRPDVDLVCVTTPPNLHCEQVIFAAGLGKAILCEKPMAMNTSEAEAMCRAARESGILALIDHELRFQKGRQIAREMLHSGEIGMIRHVKYSFRNAMRGDVNVPWNWWSDSEAGGGTLGAIGSHAIDSILWLLGADISSVSCQLHTHVRERIAPDGKSRRVTTDDETLMMLGFSAGPISDHATGIVSLSMIEYPDYEHWIEFVGSNGSLKIHYLGEVYVTKPGGHWTKVETPIGNGVPGLFDSGFPNGFVSFAPLIIEAVRKGDTSISNAASFEDGLRVQRILDAAHESDRTGARISIPTIPS